MSNLRTRPRLSSYPLLLLALALAISIAAWLNPPVFAIEGNLKITQPTLGSTIDAKAERENVKPKSISRS